MSQDHTPSIPHRKTIPRGKVIQALVLALGFIVISVLILTYQTSTVTVVDLELGDVASEDVLAPQQFTYVSEIATERARDEERRSVDTIYTPPNPAVARQQVETLGAVFDYLETVRADPYGSRPEKAEWITAIDSLSLSETAIDQILILNDDAWPETRAEARSILNQAMRSEIREAEVGSIRRQLPTFVALDTPEDQADVIVSITEDMIAANTFPDEAKTEAEKQAKADAVPDVEITVEKNELIIPAGRIVSPRDAEALEALVPLQEAEINQSEDFIAPIVLMVLITLFLGAYITRYAQFVVVDNKRLVLLTILLLVFIALARFVIPLELLFYMYPIAALTIIVVTLIEAQLAFVLTVILALLSGFIATENIREVVIYFIASGWIGALAVGRAQRMPNLLWAGVYVGLANIGVIAMFNLPQLISPTREVGLLFLYGGVINTILSIGLALVSLLIIGSFTGFTTAIQLSELTHPTRPLLRQLLLDAPGTYHHSLMVGNLGEQAAERIGADALLVRVMAYYHDIGKMQRPYFFAENQPGGVNVHEQLDPQISAQIIISHVPDGLELAKKHRLPRALREGIAQHQGTDIVKYFYYQALKAAEDNHAQVDENHFRYPGPKPQTKETGILMLADVCEATVRAIKPTSADEIDEIVQKMIADKVSSGQLDECDLTIADLHHIRQAFVDILQGVHHPRIKYPDQAKAPDTKPMNEEDGDDDDEGESKAEAMDTTSETDDAPQLPSESEPAPQLQAVSSKSSAQPTPLIRRE